MVAWWHGGGHGGGHGGDMRKDGGCAQCDAMGPQPRLQASRRRARRAQGGAQACLTLCLPPVLARHTSTQPRPPNPPPQAPSSPGSLFPSRPRAGTQRMPIQRPPAARSAHPCTPTLMETPTKDSGGSSASMMPHFRPASRACFTACARLAACLAFRTGGSSTAWEGAGLARSALALPALHTAWRPAWHSAPVPPAQLVQQPIEWWVARRVLLREPTHENLHAGSRSAR